MKAETKQRLLVVAAVFLTLVLPGAFIALVNGTEHAAAPPAVFQELPEASVESPAPAARFAAPHAMHLGVSLIEAGVDSGYVPDGGFLLTWNLVTPVASQFGDDPPITAIECRAIGMDLVTGTVTVYIGTVGGNPQRVRVLTLQLSAAQENSFALAIKNAVAARLGVTFQ